VRDRENQAIVHLEERHRTMVSRTRPPPGPRTATKLVSREPAEEISAVSAASSPDSAGGRRWPPRVVYAVATAVIIATGLWCRSPGAGLPWPVAKWNGSVLWGAMVYVLVALARPNARSNRKLAVAVAIVLLVEFSRLCHIVWLDEFRTTRAGAILLGRLFSPWNIVAYVIGVLASRIVDVIGRREFRRTLVECAPNRQSPLPGRARVGS
jgi:hypothetical protein